MSLPLGMRDFHPKTNVVSKRSSAENILQEGESPGELDVRDASPR
jgi:hypothetical protein